MRQDSIELRQCQDNTGININEGEVMSKTDIAYGKKVHRL